MTRYYDYEDRPPCEPPEKHQFAMNGSCSICRRTKRWLIDNAKRTLAICGVPVPDKETPFWDVYGSVTEDQTP